MRLIDADKVSTNIVWMKTANDMFKAEIDRQPTVDAEQTVHAEWKPTGSIDDYGRLYYRCSACGRAISRQLGLDIYKDCPYCHCGAKMDGGKS